MSPPPIEELAEKLRARRALPDPKARRALRKAAGASLSDVAVPCDVSKQTVANWEAGLCDPRGSNLAAYLDVLRVLREAA
jgi:predicted transcriptional regulator